MTAAVLALLIVAGPVVLVAAIRRADPFQQMADAGYSAILVHRMDDGDWLVSIKRFPLGGSDEPVAGKGPSTAAAVADALEIAGSHTDGR